MTLPRYEPFNAEIGGRTYSGTWHIEDGKVMVSSAYGSDWVKVGKTEPLKAARRVLQVIVAKYEDGR